MSLFFMNTNMVTNANIIITDSDKTENEVKGRILHLSKRVGCACRSNTNMMEYST